MAKLMLLMKSGTTVFVDTSAVACREFGWRHGDRFTDTMGNAGEVMGVGSAIVHDAAFKVLWVILDKDKSPDSTAFNGYASYYVNHAHTADASACMRRQNPADIVDEIFGNFKNTGHR